jgi:hypothetical protein
LIIDEQLKQQQPTVLYPFETKDLNDVFLNAYGWIFNLQDATLQD